MKQTPSGGRRIFLGQIVRVHGIRGEVVVRTHTGDPGDIAAYGPLTDADGNAPLVLSVVRVSDKGVVARVAGVDDRTAAEALRGRELYVLRSQLPEADAGEYYHTDLIGLAAVNADGQRVGRVVSVQNFGAGDLLEVLRDGSKDSELIPFTDACVPDVDFEKGEVTIVPPEMTGEPEPADNDAGEAANDTSDIIDSGGGDSGGD